MNSLKLENLTRSIDIGGGLVESQTKELQTQASDVAPESGLTAAPSGSFTDMIQNALEKVNNDQVNADVAVREVISGRNKNIHEALMAVEKADLSLKLMTQVRNKVLDAYREIMRMQV